MNEKKPQKQGHLEPLKTRSEPRQRWHDVDDDDSSGHYFMSEPSMSEAETTEYYQRIEPLLTPREGSPADSPTMEDLLKPAAASPPPPPTSPGGNTSLSSWDSPHLFRKKVQLFFSPDNGKRAGVPSSASTSSASTKQRHASLEFLQNLKRKSVGKLKDARPDEYDSVHTKLNGADQSEVDAVIRGGRGLRRNLETQQVARADTDQDETLVMVLSATDDEEEDEGATKNTRTTEEPLDWEQKHSADDEKTGDEKTLERQRRRRANGSSSKAVAGHRRTRSGDAAAASLMTKGTDWKGMHTDQLPLPSALEVHEEEDEHDNVARSNRPIASSESTSPSRNKRNKTASRTAPATSSTGVFSIGASPGKNTGRSSKRTRRFPRMRRPQPFLPLERHETVSSFEEERMSRDMFSQYALEAHGTIPAYVNRGPSPSNESLSTIEQPYAAEHSDESGHVRHSRRRSSSDADLRLPIFERPRGHQRRFSEITFESRLSPYSQSQRFPAFDTRLSPYSQSERFPSFTHGYQWPSPRTDRYPSPLYYQNAEGSFQSGNAEGSSSSSSGSSDYSRSSDEEARGIHRNQLSFDSRELREAERLLENRDFRGESQHMLRHKTSPFQNFGKPAPRVASRASFKPVSHDVGDYPTFICPVCKTRQREFFTTSTAPSQFEGPAGYLALYFAMYVIAALFIFGLEEGWESLDCVYFAVITLTTAGLGDFHPTSDGAKILCSIFIYFGVACIGLLLGSYLASMLDDKSYKEARRNRVENCTNCARIKNHKTMARRRRHQQQRRTPHGHHHQQTAPAMQYMSERNMNDHTNFGHHLDDTRQSHLHEAQNPAVSSGQKPFNIDPSPGNSAAMSASRTQANENGSDNVETKQSDEAGQPGLGVIKEGEAANLGVIEEGHAGLGVIDSYAQQQQQQQPYMMSPEPTRQVAGSPNLSFGSPLTSQILGRQSHTRHMSLFDGSSSLLSDRPQERVGRTRQNSEDLSRPPMAAAIPESAPYQPHFSPNSWTPESRVPKRESDEDSDDVSTTSESSISSEADIVLDKGALRLKTAKYVFLTLQRALMNSILIIAIGGLGFYTIEGMTAVDSFYFTTVLLTTVGYGDVVPVTWAGKLFATVYVLVAGTVLLNNMSMISMIPLELRKRRIERAVLTQFGDQLDDAALAELATGPLVRSLQLSSHSKTGLNECTREMFALAMLVRLGKVTETDIKQTFAAFRRLDVDNDGVLSSKSIIAGMMQKQRRATQERNECPPPPPPSAKSKDHGTSTFWFGRRGSLHVRTDDESFLFPSPSERSRPGGGSERSSLLGQNIGYDSFGAERLSSFGSDVECGPPQ